MLTKTAKCIAGYYLLIVLYWAALFLLGIKYSPVNYWYQFAFGLIPLIGGMLGLVNSWKWGLLKSQVGKAVFYLSAGLLTWGLGQMVWSYYTIVGRVEIPYPSLADVGYIVSWPLWTLGMVNLSLATGAKFSLRRIRGKLMLMIVPILASAASYYLLFVIARGGAIDYSGGSLKLFFDLAYPAGDVVILTLALVIFGLSWKYLGGKFKMPIQLILGGFVVNYFTDFAFSYTTTTAAYYNGHWVDLMFPTAMGLIAVGINSLSPDLIKGTGKA